MENRIFIEQLCNKGWNIKTVDISNLVINSSAKGRVTKTIEEYKEFLKIFSLCSNREDNIWFLSYQDFSKNDENSFSWNEFECQSIDSALDEEMLSDIKSFWDKHLPILMSVKNGYSYVAIGIGEFNNGKIFYGTEPEYEDVAIIANSFYEFKEKYISALNGKDCENFYQYII